VIGWAVLFGAVLTLGAFALSGSATSTQLDRAQFGAVLVLGLALALLLSSEAVGLR